MDLSHLLTIRLAPGCCEQRNESLALIIVCIPPEGCSVSLFRGKVDLIQVGRWALAQRPTDLSH
jgi:hypothetical protein